MKLFKTDHHGRYLVASDTAKDGRSTYPQCWGSNARYDKVVKGAFDSLTEAIEFAAQWRSGAVVIDTHTGRPVGRARLAKAGGPNDYPRKS